MSEQTHTRPRSHRKAIIITIIVIVIVAAWGIISRIEASSKLRDETEDLATPTVSVIKAPSGPNGEEVILPGTVQAWHEAPIYARTNGYIKEWKTDIGSEVEEGDLLAEIETPEVDAQLHQAQADMATAEANNKLAQSTAVRWQALLKTNSVSKQETDEKVSDAAAKAAAVASARANVDRLLQMEGFKQVIAPFAGVITVRNIDTGSLINAGSGSTSGVEMFHVAEVKKLRIYTQVPENYTQSVTKDTKVGLYFPSHPGKPYTAALLDTAHAIDPAARTLLVQFVADNAAGELMPGGYVEVHLKLSSSGNNVRLPANTLIFRSAGIQVATIDADNKAQLKSIVMGRDFGKEVEILSGISVGENVVVNPPDSIVSGEKVHIAEPTKDDDKKSDGKDDRDKTGSDKDEKKDEKKS